MSHTKSHAEHNDTAKLRGARHVSQINAQINLHMFRSMQMLRSMCVGVSVCVGVGVGVGVCVFLSSFGRSGYYAAIFG